MYHIWDVLNFTISATLIGLFLLLIKALFHDKLTARWHYFIWTVLLWILVLAQIVLIIWFARVQMLLYDELTLF